MDTPQRHLEDEEIGLTAGRVAEAIRIGSLPGAEALVVAVDGGELYLLAGNAQVKFEDCLRRKLPNFAIHLLSPHLGGESWSQALATAFLDSLAKTGPDPKRASSLAETLSQIRWSPAVAEAVHSRLLGIAGDAQHVFLVPSGTGIRASGLPDELIESVFFLSNAVKARAVVFFECAPALRSHRFCRVPGAVMPLETFRNDVRERLTHLGPESPPNAPEGVLQRLLGYLRPQKSDELKGTKPPRDEERWIDFIAQCSYPDVRHVDEIIVQMRLAQTLVDSWYASQENGRTNHCVVDLVAEERELRKRAWFAAILYAVMPDVITRARLSLSGALSLYSSQVQALSPVRGTGLFAVSFEQDGALASLFQRGMSSAPALEHDTSGETAPPSLVARFPSVSALRRHIEWQFGSAPLREAGLDAWEHWLRNELRSYVDDLAAEIPSQFPKVPWILLQGHPHPEVLLERAAWLLDAIELVRPNHIDKNRGDWTRSDPSARTLLCAVRDLLGHALDLSDATMRFEALILRSRYLALEGEELLARSCIEDARRLSRTSTSSSSLQNLLVRLAKNYVRELLSGIENVPAEYMDIGKKAYEANADEVLWRCVLGTLRCSVAQVQNAGFNEGPNGAQQALRARILLQIQTSRSPRLLSLAEPSARRVFVSFRGEARGIAADVIRMLRERLDVRSWFDEKIDPRTEDFGPKIQKELSECSAVLVLISPGFWTSQYCCSEMWFATSRYSLSGGHVPIYWLAIEEYSLQQGQAPPTAEDSFKASVKKALASTDKTPAQGALLHFLRDVSEGRVLRFGIRVDNAPLRGRRDADGMLSWEDTSNRKEAVIERLLGELRRH